MRRPGVVGVVPHKFQDASGRILVVAAVLDNHRARVGQVVQPLDQTAERQVAATKRACRRLEQLPLDDVVYKRTGVVAKLHHPLVLRVGPAVNYRARQIFPRLALNHNHRLLRAGMPPPDLKIAALNLAHIHLAKMRYDVFFAAVCQNRVFGQTVRLFFADVESGRI